MNLLLTVTETQSIHHGDTKDTKKFNSRNSELALFVTSWSGEIVHPISPCVLA